MDTDYNNFDSFHVTTPHPRMSPDEWMRAFRDAWAEFYSFDHMRKSLLRQNPHTYWGVLKNFIWYRAGMIEGAHPDGHRFLPTQGPQAEAGDVPPREPLGLLQAPDPGHHLHHPRSTRRSSC